MGNIFPTLQLGSDHHRERPQGQGQCRHINKVVQNNGKLVLDSEGVSDTARYFSEGEMKNLGP